MARYFGMSTLKEEILSLKESLKQLELGRRNVIQHLQVHVDNYAATFRQFVEKVEQLIIVVQEEQNNKLASHNCDLEARILGLNEDNAALQCVVMSIIGSVFKYIA